MQPSTQVVEAIRWMEQELPKSQMPMVASRLEEIIDAIKMNGKSIDWASGSDYGVPRDLPGGSEVLVAGRLPGPGAHSSRSHRERQRAHSGDHGHGRGPGAMD